MESSFSESPQVSESPQGYPLSNVANYLVRILGIRERSKCALKFRIAKTGQQP